MSTTQATLSDALVTIPCRCGSRQTVLRPRFDLKGNPLLVCLACGKEWTVRIGEVRK